LKLDYNVFIDVNILHDSDRSLLFYSSSAICFVFPHIFSRPYLVRSRLYYSVASVVCDAIHVL